MAAEAEANSQFHLLFTAPWEPVLVRRGDALGLRALADQFADAVAPDLSDRVRDGRWVTILAWCLVRSDAIFHSIGGRSVETRTEERDRYAWLRPLELMWVARTIALADDHAKNRALAGQRSVRPWYEYGRVTDRFGMSEDQFRAYRQTGMYGGYRIAFRKWPGMTVNGDGWTPGPSSIKLAKWLDAKLGVARPSWPLQIGDNEQASVPTPNKRSIGKEHEWWLRHWKEFTDGGRNADENTLPRLRSDFGILPEESNELKPLLGPLIFGRDQNGRRREAVATEVERSSASTHIEICEHLSVAFASDPTIKLLPHFSRLADAGIVAMNLVSEMLSKGGHVKLADVARHAEAAEVCEELMAAANNWIEKAAKIQLRHIKTADRFAHRITCVLSDYGVSPIECLRALLQHHEEYGGGLRWFVLRNGIVEPRTPPRVGSSQYRFRLWSLCRLATQCGVLRTMPTALLGLDDEAVDENSETTDD